jgi:GPN-loop GTPase
VSFIGLDITEEDSISVLLQHIDNAIQYGEDLEPPEPKGDFDDGYGDD